MARPIKLRVLAAAGALALLAAGCSAKTTGGAGGDTGTLVVASGVDVTNFDPTALSGGNQNFLHQIYDTLFTVGADGKPVGDLASAWTLSPDGKQLSVTLQSGVKFHSGNDLTADDVASTLQRYIDPKVGANLASKLAPVTKVETPDATHVVFDLSAPTPGIYSVLANMFILDPAGVDKLNQTDAGTGPYQVTNWSPGTSYTMTRFENYWKKPLPAVKEIQVKVVPDSQGAVALLQTGQADIATNLSSTDSQSLSKQQGYTVTQAAVGSTATYLAVNTRRKPFDNKLVRQAISKSIDRTQITSTVYPGEATPACLPWPSTSWAAPKSLADSCTFDLDQAKSLLSQAGYPNGFSTTVNVSVDSYAPGSQAVAVVLQQDLAKIGVKLNINNYDQAAARAKILSNDYDMLIHTYGDADSDPSFNFPGLTFGPAKGSFSGFDSPAYDAAVDAGAHSTTQADRVTAYQQVAQIVLDEAFIDPISFRGKVYAMRSTVKGFASDAAGYPILTGITK